jgi:predicted AlkP superfamily pyrophosphatase or phosphodiesterase
MRSSPRSLVAALALLLAPPSAAGAAQRRPPPRLVVVVSVDQLSADLFAEHRARFTAGLARLADGVVFPSGYQSHAATETCPGHATILTGVHPGRAGIPANEWVDLRVARPDNKVYCVEDERREGTSSTSYVVSDLHLRVPTLGDRLKAVTPRSRVVAVAGKDRAAVMMAGHRADETWWWDGKAKAFVSYAGRKVPPAVEDQNRKVGAAVASQQPARELPAPCRRYDRALQLTPAKAVGTGRFARPAGAERPFRASPELDEATLDLARALLRDARLGSGEATDLLAIGLSATDYVGHTYGTGGTEMCVQLHALDRALGGLLDALDATRVDYVVVLTADHGGHDTPERERQLAAPTAARASAELDPQAMGAKLAADLGLAPDPERPLLRGATIGGDVWLDARGLDERQRRAALTRAAALYAAHEQVAAVLTREQILSTPPPRTPPETWTLLERARASFDPERSGDLVVALKPLVTMYTSADGPYIAGHGSFWDYDRRVPILFWRNGLAPFEQALPVEVVDIAPTLAALLGLKLPPGELDGRCLDLVAGPETSCPAPPP